MATARLVREEPVTPPIKNVVLTLTAEEAKNLNALLACTVSGTGSVRDMSNSILHALEKAGLPYTRMVGQVNGYAGVIDYTRAVISE